MDPYDGVKGVSRGAWTSLLSSSRSLTVASVYTDALSERFSPLRLRGEGGIVLECYGKGKSLDDD